MVHLRFREGLLPSPTSTTTRDASQLEGKDGKGIDKQLYVIASSPPRCVRRTSAIKLLKKEYKII